MREEEIREILLKENESFKELFEEHQKLEKRLNELLNKWYLTAEEQEEERQIKKRKLMIKDRMYAIIAEYRRNLEGAPTG